MVWSTRKRTRTIESIERKGGARRLAWLAGCGEGEGNVSGGNGM